jgi:hypothetical protein
MSAKKVTFCGLVSKKLVPCFPTAFVPSGYDVNKPAVGVYFNLYIYIYIFIYIYIYIPPFNHCCKGQL